jgi:hypothetical protein
MTFPESPEAFGASLKAERLRQGLSLAAISQATKITESHFVALERGDLRHWPKGIFRRAFFSDYVRALGLPLEPALSAFSRVFPDDTNPAPVVSPNTLPPGASGLRLSLAPSPLLGPDTVPRARAAALDALLVVVAATLVSRLAPEAAGWIVALTALLYYSILAVLGIDGPAVRLLAWARHPAWPQPGWLQRLPKLLSSIRFQRNESVAGWLSHALARVAAMSKNIRLSREAAAPRDAKEDASRGRPVRSDEIAQSRHERRMSPRTARSRPEPPSVRVRIRLTR